MRPSNRIIIWASEDGYFYASVLPINPTNSHAVIIFDSDEWQENQG